VTPVELDREPLSIESVATIARGGAPVALGARAKAQVEEANRALVTACDEGAAIYGASTGVGTRDRVRIAPRSAEPFQASLLRSHAMGVGDPAPGEEVRAMMTVRASQLAMGRSGMALPTLEAFIAMLDRGVTPRVPSVGSVGASDLCPLAHAALPLIGEGHATFEGRLLPGAEALRAAGIERPTLAGRDALAWMAGPAFAVGRACLTIVGARRVLDAAEHAGALTMHALGSSTGAFDPELIALKPHPGAVRSAARLRALLPDAATGAREPLSIRCLPYVVGAGRDALRALEDVVAIELASPTDNPIWRRDLGFFGGGATFDTHRLALVLDGLADALLPIAGASERRIERLCNPTESGGLPAFLIGPGEGAERSSGMMIAQYTAASLLARMRARAPVSGLGISTCNGFEDAVSLAPLAAERAAEALRDTARVLAFEHVVAARAIDLCASPPRGLLAREHARVRRFSAFVRDDRSLGDEVEALAEAIRFEGGSAEPGVVVTQGDGDHVGDGLVVVELRGREAFEAQGVEARRDAGSVGHAREGGPEDRELFVVGSGAGDERQRGSGTGPHQPLEAVELPGGDVGDQR
jgi:histidine ammonia-lyase